MVRPAQAQVRAAIYCRLSRADDPDDTGNVDDQEQRCRVLAEKLGWTVVEPFKDNSKSAWKPNRRRPAWEEMLGGLDVGKFNAIIVYHGDRLIRQPWDLERLITLADQKGIRLASPTGERDLDNPDDRFVLRIEAAHACREVDNMRRRFLRGQERLAAAGKPGNGGRRPFGYELDLVTVRESEAKVVREVADRVLAGETSGAICRDLNARGIRTSLGGQWVTNTLRKVMMRARNAGLRSHNGVVVGPAIWPAILDEDTWRAVCTILDGRRARVAAYSTHVRRYLLTGIARCGTCGEPLTVRWSTRANIKGYGCINRPCSRKVHCQMAHLDAYVVREIVARLADRRLAEQLAEEEHTDRVRDRAEVARLTAKLQTIASDYGADLITREQMLTSTEDTRSRLAEIEQRLVTQQRRDTLAELPVQDAEEFLALPLGTRRAIVTELFERIVVGPAATRGPGFDRSRVQLVPR